MGNPNQYPGKETQNEKANETRGGTSPGWDNRGQQEQKVAQAIGNLAVNNSNNR